MTKQDISVILETVESHGNKWKTSIESTLTDIYFYDKKHGWAVGQEGMIVGTSDGGKTLGCPNE